MTDTGIVDLAHTADFRLGDVLIRPARRQVVKDGAETELLQPRVMQVLIVLAEAKGAIVTREELTEACWRGRVVGDDAVNRVISRLRRLANTLGEGSFRIETVPKVGYRLETLTQGHAASTAESPPSQPATPARIQRRTVPPGGLLVGVLIILLGAGVWLWNADGRWPWSAGEGPLVAVAPFEAIGGGAAARELAKAVTGDAVSALGADSVQTVSVTSVSSAPSSAHLVLNGEIQQTRDDARVTLRLFDPEARAILWSGEVAGEPTNVAERASLKAADMLTCGLKGFASKARLDAQARVLWLRTCDTWRQRGTLGQARDAMRVLMQRAPEFAGGYAKYALATLRMIPAGVPWGARAARGEARGAALHALKLDPNEADAYVALSLTEPTTDWAARERWLLMGLTHQPNSGDLINWEAYLLSMVGRIAEGLPLARRSVELDPHSAVKTVDLAARLYFAGETSEATKVEQAAELRWPESPDVLDFAFERAIRRGRRVRPPVQPADAARRYVGRRGSALAQDHGGASRVLCRARRPGQSDRRSRRARTIQRLLGGLGASSAARGRQRLCLHVETIERRERHR